MNRDSKGRFCGGNFSDENELVQQIGSKKKYSDIHTELMIGKPGDYEWWFSNIKNDETKIDEEEYDPTPKYTVGVKVVAYYDVDVRANSPEEAIEKISEMDSYKLLTEEIPVDSRDPVFSWLALQDE